MTNERMEPLELVEKAADADLGRELLAFAAARNMDAEVAAVAGAGKGARSASGAPTARSNQSRPDAVPTANAITLLAGSRRKRGVRGTAGRKRG